MQVSRLHRGFGALIEPSWSNDLSGLDSETLKTLVKETGALLVRGFVADREVFETFSKQFMAEYFIHHSAGGARDVIGKDGVTTTVDKGWFPIPWHRERAYAPKCPDIVAFYCVCPAEHGGETLLCDGIDLLDRLKPATRHFVLGAKLRWRWRAPIHKWATTLGVKNQQEADNRLRQITAALPPFETLRWRILRETMAGVYETPCAGITKWGDRRVFCNYVINGFSQPCFRLSLDSGEPFPLDVINEAADHANAIAYAVRWRPGDILVFDNSRVMHGRNAFKGHNRQILARMGYVARAGWGG